MALAARRRAENVPGDLFVDASCIDCDTCRWMAPDVFARRGGQSAVVQQPVDGAQRRAALQALVACPTASIGTVAKAPDLPAAQGDFPLPITPEVFHCGYHDASSFGATSYLLRMPAGNALVDVPRFAAPLVRRIEELGGVRWILLTHRDDVGDHGRWARHFGADRVLHRRDAPIRDGPVERWLDGDDVAEITPGLRAIPTPGHTAGHVCYHWSGGSSGEGALFTGDHVAFDDEAGHLEAWPEVCWFDWGQQTASMERLQGLDVAWVLPGHGRRAHLDPATMRSELVRLTAWMRQQR